MERNKETSRQESVEREYKMKDFRLTPRQSTYMHNSGVGNGVIAIKTADNEICYVEFYLSKSGFRLLTNQTVPESLLTWIGTQECEINLQEASK